MKQTFWFAMLLAVATGCSRLTIHQTETDETGYLKETVFKAGTFFDGKSELTKARTTMTDKSQGIGVSGLSQESSSTGAVQIIKIIVEGAKPVVP